MVDVPKYDTYSLIELYVCLNSIRADRYPHVYEALVAELESRQSESILELEDCYWALDRQKNPEYAEKLAQRIQALRDSDSEPSS